MFNTTKKFDSVIDGDKLNIVDGDILTKDKLARQMIGIVLNEAFYTAQHPIFLDDEYGSVQLFTKDLAYCLIKDMHIDILSVEDVYWLLISSNVSNEAFDVYNETVRKRKEA